MKWKYLLFALLAAISLLATVSGNEWMVACDPATGLLQYQPGIIESNRAWAYGDFNTNNGEEVQPVLTEAQVGPIRMLLPGYLYSENITYDRPYSDVAEGFRADYVKVDILFEPWDAASALREVMSGRGIDADESQISTDYNRQHPIAYYESGRDRIGVCSFGANTIVVSIDNDRPGRLTTILNSIH